MPLSEHEQRAFDQMMERTFAEDPKFASAVRSTDPRVHARRRLVVAVLIILAGLAVVVVGTVSNLLPLGVGGFVIMLAGAAYAMSQRRPKYPPLQLVDGGGSRASRRRSSLVDRLEERWRRRPEGHR